MKYKILAQFVKAGVKFDEPVQKAVEESVSHYNSRSLIAKNPKQIIDYCFSEDQTTMEIIFESNEILPVPSKALRLLSTYLANETFLGEGGYLAGKQLFKMTSSEMNDEGNGVNELEKISDIDGVELLYRVNEKAAKLIMGGNLEPIYKFLEEEKYYDR